MGTQQSQYPPQQTPSSTPRRNQLPSEVDQQADKDLDDLFKEMAKLTCLEYFDSQTLHNECVIRHEAVYRAGYKVGTSQVKSFLTADE